MHVAVRLPVKAGLDTAWQRLRDVGDLTWMTGVRACSAEPLAVGSRRTVTMDKPAYGKDTLVEVVERVEDHGFAYRIEGGIGPLRSIRTAWRLRPSPEGCELHLESDVHIGGAWTLLWPLVRLAWRKRLLELGHAFARHVEALQQSQVASAA